MGRPSADDDDDDDDDAEEGEEVNGKKLFRKEEFEGNGRTCETCHSK